MDPLNVFSLRQKEAGTCDEQLACVAGGILVPGEHLGRRSHHAKWEGFSRAAKQQGKMPPAAFLMSFDCRPLLSPCLERFDYPSWGVVWWGSNTKLTCKRARPSVTIKSRTKQLFVESFSGSRQDILQLLQTWETKSFIKRSFSRNKKLYASKEVKKIPKMLQRSNSVRNKNHRKSMLECTGNTSASWPLNRQRWYLLSQKQRILHGILHQYF